MHRGSLQDICLEINKKKQASKPIIEKEKEKPKKKESVESIKKKYEEPVQVNLKNLKPVKNIEPVEHQNGENHYQVEEEIEKPKVIETVQPKTIETSQPKSIGNDVGGKTVGIDLQPPKPLPRSTRSNSIDLLEDRPVAKPRMHKNSIDSSQPNSLTDYSEMENENNEIERRNDLTTNIVIEKSQPSVIQSVNPNLPISGGYKVRHGDFVLFFFMIRVASPVLTFLKPESCGENFWELGF